MTKQKSMDNPGIFAQMRMSADGTYTLPFELFRELPASNIEKTMEIRRKERAHQREVRIRNHERARDKNRRKR